MQLLNDGIGVQSQVLCLQSLYFSLPFPEGIIFQTWSLIYVFLFICIDPSQFLFKKENSSQG